MEFFSQINKAISPEELQKQLQIEDIPHYCSFVSEVRPDGNDGLEMISFWGVHTVQREMIRGGVRFSLPGCPNVMSWTITSGLPPEPDTVVIHCVINRREHDPDFIESLEAFVEDWKAGLESRL